VAAAAGDAECKPESQCKTGSECKRLNSEISEMNGDVKRLRQAAAVTSIY
jgi:hypothetical protein